MTRRVAHGRPFTQKPGRRKLEPEFVDCYRITHAYFAVASAGPIASTP